MAPLFSKVDSNKLWHDVQNEETAKFDKDLFNISKVVGRKTKWPRFFSLSGILIIYKNAHSLFEVMSAKVLTIAKIIKLYL